MKSRRHFVTYCTLYFSNASACECNLVPCNLPPINLLVYHRWFHSCHEIPLIDRVGMSLVTQHGDLEEVVGAPFLGFMLGSVSVNTISCTLFLRLRQFTNRLFGATILQVYQYYLNYAHDSRVRKLTMNS